MKITSLALITFSVGILNLGCPGAPSPGGEGEGEGGAAGEGEGAAAGEGEGAAAGEGEGAAAGEGEGAAAGEGEGAAAGEGEGAAAGEGEGAAAGEGEGAAAGEGEGEGEGGPSCIEASECGVGGACDGTNHCVTGVAPGASCTPGVSLCGNDNNVHPERCYSETNSPAAATCHLACGFCAGNQACTQPQDQTSVCVAGIADGDHCDVAGLANACTDGQSTCVADVGGATCRTSCQAGGTTQGCNTGELCFDPQFDFSGACFTLGLPGDACDPNGQFAPCTRGDSCNAGGHCVAGATCAVPTDINTEGVTSNPTLFGILGDLNGAGDDEVSAGCSPGGEDQVFSFTVNASAHVVAQLQPFDHQMVLSARTDCVDLLSEITCTNALQSQQGGNGEINPAGIDLGVQIAGTVLSLVVDGLDTPDGRAAPYLLSVRALPVVGNNASCDVAGVANECIAGHFCNPGSERCTPTVCGDGFVGGTEQCDDGNVVSTDGCESDCSRTTANESEPNNQDNQATNIGAATSVLGSIGGGDNRDTFQVDVGAGDAVSAGTILVDDGLGCTSFQGWQLVLTLCDGNPIAQAQSQGQFGATCPTIDTGAFVGPGSVCIEIQAQTQTGQATNYDMTFTGVHVPVIGAGSSCDPAEKTNICGLDAAGTGFLVCVGAPTACAEPACGDGVVSAGEQCDDGGVTPGDGCDATCHVEIQLESEPNNNAQVADTIGNAAFARGRIAQADTDFYSVVLTGTGFIDLVAQDGSGACGSQAMQGADLKLFGTDKTTLLAESTFDQTGQACARIQGTSATTGLQQGQYTGPLPAGTYFISIKSSNATFVASQDYVISVSRLVLPVRSQGQTCDPSGLSDACGGGTFCSAVDLVCVVPACGDGVINGSEACDDHNTVNGDGCSSTCTREVTAEQEPNDTPSSAQLLPAHDLILVTGNVESLGAQSSTDRVDWYELTITGASQIRAVLSDGATCSTPSVLALYDDQGFALDVENNFQGCPTIDSNRGGGLDSGQASSAIILLEPGVYDFAVTDFSSQGVLDYSLDITVTHL